MNVDLLIGPEIIIDRHQASPDIVFYYVHFSNNINHYKVRSIISNTAHKHRIIGHRRNHWGQLLVN